MDAHDRKAQRRDFSHLTTRDGEAAPVVSSVFFGYSAEWLAEVCLVEPETARRWKRRESIPTPQALKLFELHRDGRILGPEWDGWKIVGADLVDPEGNTTTQGQLRAYYVNYQLLHELMRGNADAQARWAKALELAG